MNKGQREVPHKSRIFSTPMRPATLPRHVDILALPSSFDWCCRIHGDAGLANQPPIPRWQANRMPVEIEEEIPCRLARFHGWFSLM